MTDQATQHEILDYLQKQYPDADVRILPNGKVQFIRSDDPGWINCGFEWDYFVDERGAVFERDRPR